MDTTKQVGKKRLYRDFFRKVRQGIEAKVASDVESPLNKAYRTEKGSSPKKKRKLFVWREEIILIICSFLHADEICVLFCLNHHWHSVLSDKYYCDSLEENVAFEEKNLDILDTLDELESSQNNISLSSTTSVENATKDLKIIDKGDYIIIDLTSDDDSEGNKPVENVSASLGSDGIIESQELVEAFIELDEEEEIRTEIDTATLLREAISDDLVSLEGLNERKVSESTVSLSQPILPKRPVTHTEKESDFKGTTLYCDDFFIRLTEPYWTLCLNPECFKTFLDIRDADYLLDMDGCIYHCYYIDYSRPIFSVDQFLKVLRFFKSNSHLLDRSGFADLSELFFRLQPYSSVAITDRGHISFLLAQLYQILEIEESQNVQESLDKDATVPVGNLAFICARYIDSYKGLFAQHSFCSRKKKDLFKIVWKQDRVQALFKNCQVPIHIDQVYRYDIRQIDENQFTIYDDETVHLYQKSHQIIRMCMESLFVSIIDDYDGGIYRGDVTRMETEPGIYTIVPHGEGLWKSLIDDNEWFQGYWIEGERCGEGHFESEKIVYDGEWYRDTFHGKGTLIFKSRNCAYHGKFVYGKRNGFGLQYFTELENGLSVFVEDKEVRCSSWYRGQWCVDVQHGIGEYRSCGLWKQGEYRNGVLREGISQELNTEDNLWYVCTVSNYRTISRRRHIPYNFLRQRQLSQDEDTVFDFVADDYDEDGLIMYSSQNTANKARRTVWNGYLFRSRLEARWSIFFEYLKIDYLYEPKTFSLPNDTRYTPDFYLPAYSMWLEIKPCYPTEEERTKAKLLAQLLQHSESKDRVLIFYGNVHAPFIKKHIEGAKAIEFTQDKEIEPVAWTQCNECAKFSVGYRCQPLCHPNANRTSVEPTLIMKMAYDYVHTIDFEAFNENLNVDDSIISCAPNLANVSNMRANNMI